MLRLLDNENLSVDQIKDVQDDVNYYIESNQDPDFQVLHTQTRARTNTHAHAHTHTHTHTLNCKRHFRTVFLVT
jgi:CCR4-NOT transcriptional regulation complex NOT5 subunit